MHTYSQSLQRRTQTHVRPTPIPHTEAHTDARLPGAVTPQRVRSLPQLAKYSSWLQVAPRPPASTPAAAKVGGKGRAIIAGGLSILDLAGG